MKDWLIPSGLVWISKLGVVLGVYHRKVPYPNGSGCYLLILQIVKYSRNVKFSSNCKMLNIQIVNTFLMEDYKQSLNFQSELLSKCRHKYKWKLVKLNSTTVVTLLLAESVCKKSFLRHAAVAKLNFKFWHSRLKTSEVCT